MLLVSNEDTLGACHGEPRGAPQAAAPASPVYTTRNYQSRRGVNWPVVAGVAAIQTLLAMAAMSSGYLSHAKPPKPLAVFDVQLQPDVPPPPPPEQKPTPPTAASPVVAPPPVVQTPSPPAQVAVAEHPALAETVPGPVASPAPPAPAPAPAPPAAGPVSVGDMSSKMIAAPPPRYPLESRRNREQGVVLLTVLLGPDGRVQDVSIRKSSGFARLDDAARSAIKRWRWSPTLRDGAAVMVRGTLTIPFILHT